MDEREIYSELSRRMIMNRRRFMMGMMAAMGTTAGAAALAACGATPTATPAAVPPTATTVSLPATPTKPSAGAAMTPTAEATEAAMKDLTPVPEEMEDKWKGSGEVVVADWGGAVKEALKTAIYEPFEKFSGIKLVNDTVQDSAQPQVMVDANAVQWDVWHDSLSSMLRPNQKGTYFDPIDYSLVDTDTIPESFRNPVALGFLPYSWALCYRSDVFTAPSVPNAWADFWDVEKFPGPRTLNGDVHPPVEFALIADGVPFDKVYEELAKPDGMDRAFKSLDKIKSNVVQWWSTGALAPQLLTDKEVVLASAWNGRISAAQAQGAPLGLTFNQAMLAMDWWAALHGRPNTENAMKFIGYASSPRPQARFSMAITYGFTNTKAGDYIPAERLAILPTSPENLKVQFLYDEQYWTDNRDKILERFVAWKGV